MPIDGCELSFETLAHDVLPKSMKTLLQKMADPIPMAEFSIRGVGPMTLRRKFGLEQDPSACYVLMDKKRPVYVGISRGVIQRLLDHVKGADHMVATLAYMIAAKQHPQSGAAKDAIQDPEFQRWFLEARNDLGI